MNRKVSVIVPIYKVEEYLNQCIVSIIQQTYRNLEIILVDDGSPDNCGAICDLWKEKDARIKVIHKVNGGLSDARNVGLRLATGEYILFVDSDDWIECNLVQLAVETLIKYNADICSFGIKNCFSDHIEIWNTPAFIGDSEDALRNLYNDTLLPVASWNKLYRKYLWEDFDFPVGKIYEDAFTTYRLIDRANCIVQIKEPLYCYRIREGSIMNSSFSMKYMDAEEAWRLNYEFVERKYPKLKREAYDFYLQKVNWILNSVPSDQRENYKDQYLFLRTILVRNFMYILFYSKLGLKQRIKMLVDLIKGVIR